jgi:hypothetical protein
MVIDARRSLRIEADQRVIVVAGLPVHPYRAEHEVAEAYAMARAFGRSVRYSTLSRALCARRDGGARSRGRMASRPTAYLR